MGMVRSCGVVTAPRDWRTTPPRARPVTRAPPARGHAAERGPKGGGSGTVLGGEVLVLHLPGMVEGVVGRVSDEEGSVQDCMGRLTSPALYARIAAT